MQENAFDEQDKKWMSFALELAGKGAYSTTPNPAVGCVITDTNGLLVGQGYHQKAGEPHAEVYALQQAGALAKGGTAYVTLEPCSHTGKTPPCAQALIDAEISKVVIASIDPNPLVNHAGITMLEDAGIDVLHGLLTDQAEHLNRAFLYRMRTGLPWVCVKLAASVDGKTALHNGVSKWITSENARTDVQDCRARHCAILTGADTVIADDPQLNVRPKALSRMANQYFALRTKQPLRIIIDSKNRLSDNYQMLKDGHPVLIINTKHNTNITSQTVEQVQLPLCNGYIDLVRLFSYLGSLQLNAIWVEAGATLIGALLDAKCVNQLVLYQAPKLLGIGAKNLVNSQQIDVLSDAIDLKLDEVVQIGDDLRISYQVQVLGDDVNNHHVQNITGNNTHKQTG